MEAKHTPGPWRATMGTSQMSDPGTTIYHQGRWGVYSDADSHGDQEADARLIAAAPELLEALKHCEDVFMRHEINRVDGEQISELALSVIRAAIAKATQ